jgi:hypothetical protein
MTGDDDAGQTEGMEKGDTHTRTGSSPASFSSPPSSPLPLLPFVQGEYGQLPCPCCRRTRHQRRLDSTTAPRVNDDGDTHIRSNATQTIQRHPQRAPSSASENWHTR